MDAVKEHLYKDAVSVPHERKSTVSHSEDCPEKDTTVLTVEKQHDKFCLYINRSAYTEVYLMNDSGKTIDSYRWSEDKAQTVRQN